MRAKRGVLYCASNSQYYLDECIYSAKTFKKYNKNIPITLYTNLKNVSESVFDSIIYDDTDCNPFVYKSRALNSFPYQYTLFIDSDTKICDSIYELFAFLDIYDMAVAKRIKAKWSKPMVFLDYEDPSAYNTGILGYRKSESTKSFFKDWMDEVVREDKEHSYSQKVCDQRCFNKLIFENQLNETHGVNIITLPNRIYNARHMGVQLKKDGLDGEVKIWHSHGLNRSLTDRVKNRIKTIIG